MQISQLNFNRGQYYYDQDTSLIPVFGGFLIEYKGKIVTPTPLKEQKVLELIQKRKEETEQAQEDDMRADYESEADFRKYEEAIEMSNIYKENLMEE